MSTESRPSDRTQSSGGSSVGGDDSSSNSEVHREAEVFTPLGESLLLHKMVVTEELGQPYLIDLELLSEDPELEFDDILGEQMDVLLRLPDEEERWFGGVVDEFSQVGGVGRYVRYKAQLRPWLWMLRYRKNCRIYQEMNVPDIIKELFREHGFTDFEEQLTNEYPPRGYCVQYRESDLNFVTRLMESSGIYYYFRFEQGTQTLVIADSSSSHAAFPSYEEVPYYPKTERFRERDHVWSWSFERRVRSGAQALTSFDFTKPRAELGVGTNTERPHAHAGYEVFDYPGGYVETDRGDAAARLRNEREQVRYETVSGEGDVRGLCCGHLFALEQPPREDQAREYLLTRVRCTLEAENYESREEGPAQYSFVCDFDAMDSQIIYRPPHTATSPRVGGPQTAIVVGKDGEEIWTDEHGRVKVQFHWDRYGERDENSSCWVRVSTAWAGQNWGVIQIPRIGQEVIVDFLEGSPDRPIITGRVYNGNNMPPYDLPASATQSGVKSRSSKGGAAANFNEIRFEDKKGEEELYVHAEKDHNQVTENCRSESVGVDRSLSVGKNKSETIGETKTINVGTDHTETIGANKTMTVGSNHTETIGSNMTVTIGSNLTESVGANYSETVGAAMTLSVGGVLAVSVGAAVNEAIGGALATEVGGIKAETVGASSSEEVGGSKSLSVGSNHSVDVGKNLEVKVGDTGSYEVEKDFTLKAKKVVLEAKDEMTLKCGSAKLILKKNGDITLQGKKINVKGSGPVIIKGSKIQEN